MARRTIIHKCETEGRDKGKWFLITEMPASKGEAWAERVILALASNGTDIGDDYASLGMAGLAKLGIRGLSGLPWTVAEPLLKEMFNCIQLIPDHKNPTFARDLEPEGGDGDDDIEEIPTRVVLRMEVLKLHVNFSDAAIRSLSERLKGLGSKLATGTESQK